MGENMNAEIEDHCLVVTADGFEARFELSRIFETMSGEEKEQLARALCFGHVMDEALKRLTGDSEWWDSEDKERGARLLASIGENSLSGAFGIWSKLIESAKSTTSHEHIYWLLYHMDEWPNYKTPRDWLNGAGISDNHVNDSIPFATWRRDLELKLGEMRKLLEAFVEDSPS